MSKSNILNERLYNQGLVDKKLKTASNVVKHLGTVQSQDYQGAKWAISLRTGLTSDEIEKEINEGNIIRTHAMRPTWHFVHRDDIRWIMDLTAPRIKAIASTYYKKIGLTPNILNKTDLILKKSLKGKNLTRIELREIFKKEKINVSGLKFGFILLDAELDKIICNGNKKEKQFTYALFDDKVPKSPPWKREDAIGELVKRYFLSHGPATLHDFVWWSGLTIADAKIGVEENKEIKSFELDKKIYWHFKINDESLSKNVLLLPNYDEFFSYKEKFFFDKKIEMMSYNPIIKEGKVIGSWKFNKSVKIFSSIPLDKSENQKLENQINSYNKFILK